MSKAWPTEFEIGYIMGIVTGEGCFTQDARQPTLSVKQKAGGRDPLDYLARVLGGTVYGPYGPYGKTTPYFMWHLRGSELREAIPLFLEHLPPSLERKRLLHWTARHFPLLIDRPSRFPSP